MDEAWTKMEKKEGGGVDGVGTGVLHPASNSGFIMAGREALGTDATCSEKILRTGLQTSQLLKG